MSRPDWKAQPSAAQASNTERTTLFLQSQRFHHLLVHTRRLAILLSTPHQSCRDNPTSSSRCRRLQARCAHRESSACARRASTCSRYAPNSLQMSGTLLVVPPRRRLVDQQADVMRVPVIEPVIFQLEAIRRVGNLLQQFRIESSVGGIGNAMRRNSTRARPSPRPDA